MEENEGDFGELLEQSSQLVSATAGDHFELPRVERNLRQLVDLGQQFWSRTALSSGRKDATNVNAAILLGSRGFDLGKISDKLDSLSVAKTLEPLEPLPKTDVEGFLRNERENAILSIIDESRNSAFKHADELYWEELKHNWKQDKLKVLGGLKGSEQDVADMVTDTRIQVTIPYGTVGGVAEAKRSVMDDVEMGYAKEVFSYTEEILQGGARPDLVKRFSHVVSKFGQKNVTDTWAMVRYMTEIPMASSGNLIRDSVVVQTAFISQARKYLEDNYMQFMRATVFGNLRQAQLGGNLGTLALVQSFLNVKLTSNMPGLKDGFVGGQPVWAIIYYCLRCGDLQAALEAAISAGPALEEFGGFIRELSNSGDRRLGPQSERVCQVTYSRSVRNSKDPFQKAAYCVLAPCDSDDHQQVADKIDDYLWLRLCQLRTEDPRSTLNQTRMTRQEAMTLPQLQSKLLEDYGEAHFRAHEQPFLYFQVLFLTAQFEAAIHFLAQVDRLRSHAVHVAIALFEEKLLLVPSSNHAQILSKDPSDQPPTRRLNFSRLILLYCRKFESTDPREALRYYYLLRNITGSKGENMFITSVSDLVLETREFDTLLGYRDRFGAKRAGLIEKFDAESERVVEMVAAHCESRGFVEDAVKLYDYSEKHGKVLSLLTVMLSQVVAQPSVPQSKRDRVRTIATEVAQRYRMQDHTSDTEATATFYLLLDMMTFFDLYHENKLQEAFSVLKVLKLVPLQQSDVERQVASFRLLADEIKRNVPEVLLATMHILYQLYTSALAASKEIAPTPAKFVAKENPNPQRVDMLRKQAQTLITFAGMLSYCLPGDTVSRLVQRETMMH